MSTETQISVNQQPDVIANRAHLASGLSFHRAQQLLRHAEGNDFEFLGGAVFEGHVSGLAGHGGFVVWSKKSPAVSRLGVQVLVLGNVWRTTNEGV